MITILFEKSKLNAVPLKLTAGRHLKK